MENNRSSPKNTTPIPTKRPVPLKLRAVVIVTVIVYTMVTTFVFSFLPKMVKSFGISELQTGYYAGMIGSSVYLGRLFFSMFWGYFADLKGKKFCSVVTQICLLLTTITFGFSTDISWSVISRLLQGCAMGQYIIATSMIADACDVTNMAEGMSIPVTSYTLGFTLGPSIGGFLVFPTELYPDVFSDGSIFGRFPIFLPVLVISIGLLIGILLTIVFVPSDMKKRDENTPLVGSYGSTTQRNYGSQYITSPDKSGLQNTTTPNISVDTLRDLEIKRKGCQIICLGQANLQCGEKEDFPVVWNTSTWSALMNRLRRSKLVKLLQIKECLLSCLLYGIFTSIDVGFIDVFPVFAATKREYNGTGFTTSQIGVVLLVASLTANPLQLTVLPKIIRRIGTKNAVVISNLVLIFIYQMFPVVSCIHNHTALWVTLISLLFVQRVIAFFAFVATTVFVNHSVGPELRGSANGLSLTFASFGRLIAPTFAGSLYSWSLTNITGFGNEDALGFPFNHFFVFLFFSAMSLFVSLFATRFVDNTEKHGK